MGAAAGQYAGTPSPDPQQPLAQEWDPNFQHVTKQSGYGTASRLTVSAVALASGPVALVEQDLYLAQDLLTRRVGQMLAAHGSRVAYDNVLLSATHDHSTPYYSTPAAEVSVFQDVFDLRFFEYPARVGATTIDQPFVLVAAPSLEPAVVVPEGPLLPVGALLTVEVLLQRRRTVVGG